jgi:hypothetical protein
MMLLRLYVFLNCAVLYAMSAKIELVITMICRDEVVNFQTNLLKWVPVADYFVFIMDTRNNDDSKVVIDTILTTNGRPYKIIDHEFTGFGHARTASLQAAWQYYSQASHVLIADPDWSPDLSTINKKDLDFFHEVFRFTVYDRNGASTRQVDWLLRHKENLKMRYHLHEVLDIGYYTKILSIPWQVHEIEKPGTWHTTVGHGNSMSPNRYKFDLEMLHRDELQYGHDPHTHYYMCVTNEAFASSTFNNNGRVWTSEVADSYDAAARYCELRLKSSYSDEFIEERWGVLYTLGSIYFVKMSNGNDSFEVRLYIDSKATVCCESFNT